MERANKRTGLPHRRRASLPNTSGYWTDLALATVARQSASTEVQAACLHVMRMRAQSEIDTPKTAWDDMLAEMKWLREDFRCKPGRKKTFFLEVSEPCMQEARRRLESFCSTSEGKGWAPGLGSSTPEWAKEEDLVQTSLYQEKESEPASEAKKDLGFDVNAGSSKQLPTEKWKS